VPFLYFSADMKILLPDGKKIYFASDFHLGIPDEARSLKRERKIIQWLESIRHDAHAIYLLGDIFDFWFEYRHTIPKGFIRFQGKLAELRDAGIAIYFFTGNHDMWMFDYFPSQLQIVVYRQPQLLEINQHKILVGHGDGLGPGDHAHKILKKVFESRWCQWLFHWLHPSVGMAIAHRWSKSSRLANQKREEYFKGDENEFLLIYCREMEKRMHHDFYVFGHRHLPLDLPAGERSRYINTGEWVNYTSYAVYDGQRMELKSFEGSRQ
jgi:UDP-2,3-diacylglucosamine hydrolase